MSNRSVREIREAVLSGDTNCEAVVAGAIERAKAIQPELNAFTILLEEEALETARAADTRGPGETPGLLHGVPLVIKDMTPTKGHPTTLGSLTSSDSRRAETQRRLGAFRQQYP